MSTSISTIRLNDNVNEERGGPFPLKLTEQGKTVFDMNSPEFEEACREAVAEREAVPSQDYVTLIDEDSGLLTKKFKNGKVEYLAGC